MNDRTVARADAARDQRPGHPPFWSRPLVPAALLVFLAGLTAGVKAGGPLVRLDHHIRAAVLARAATPGWYWLIEYRLSPARVLVNLGDSRIAVPVLLLVAAVLAVRRRSPRPLAAAAMAVVLLLVTVIPAKIIIARPLPGLGPLAPGGWGAFPSGHTTTGSACYVLAALLIGWPAPRPAGAGVAGVAVTGAVVTGAVVLSTLIGLALVWRDFHWFTDVLAGWALAALIVWVTLWLVSRITPRLPPTPLRRRPG